MKKNVLVFPSGTEIANEVINSLINHKDYNLIFASSEKECYSHFRDKKVHFLPYITDNNFLSDLNSLIKNEEIDIIIPAHDDVAFKLSELENQLNAKIIGQSFYVNKIVRFKDATYDFFKNLLPIANLFDSCPNNSDFPVFVKPKRGQGSLNAVKLDSIEEFKSFFKNHKIDDFVIMEYLNGEEFTIDCFSDKNSNVLYSGARTRSKAIKGISVLSKFINDKQLNIEFSQYAQIISHSLELKGAWFFQMKFDSNNKLKLLEIGPRISGTMMLNRVRGINFVELSILQKTGNIVSIVPNNIDISLARALVPIYKHNIVYENLYIDFDDTLFLDENIINTDVIKLIFHAKNQNKLVYLITKNSKNNLVRTLHQFGISNIFNDIYHLTPNDRKIDYMKPLSVLIDDSFSERRSAIENGHIALSNDNLHILL